MSQHIVVKITTSHQFCYDIEINVVLKHVVKSDNIRMISVLQDLQLLLHQLDQLFILIHVVFFNYLHRTLLLGKQICTLVHSPESALSKHLTKSEI